MTTESLFRVTVAPRFRMSFQPSDRLQRSGAGGDRCEPVEPPASAAQAGDVCVFRLPDHLLSQWWTLVEAGAATARGPDGLAGFDAFCAEALEFLEFKLAPVPAAAVCRLVAAGIEARPGADWWAAVNLGLEPVWVTLPDRLATESGNPPPKAAVIDGVGPVRASDAAQDGSAEGRPRCTAIQLKIEPGEGCWLPDGLAADVVSSAEAAPVLFVLREVARSEESRDALPASRMPYA